MRRVRRATWLLLIVLLAGCGGAAPLTSTPSLPPAATPGATAPPVAPTATPSGAWIALSPASGPPGTTVDITGFLPGGRPVDVTTTASGSPGTPVPTNGSPPAGGPAEPATGPGAICWADCPTGLVDADARFTWSSTQPGRFQTRFTVPAVPWLAWDGVHPLTPGDYAIGLPCLTQSRPVTTGPGDVPCTQQPAPLVATFHLTGPTTDRCRTDPCAELQLGPAVGPPGTLVHVHGWAPLNALMVGSQLSQYELAIQPAEPAAHDWLGGVQQAPNGDLSGTFRVPLTVDGLGRLDPGRYPLALQTSLLGKAVGSGILPGGVTVTPLIGTNGMRYGDRLTLAPATFTITAAPSWAALGALTPIGTAWSTGLSPVTTMVADPAHPQRLAYCDTGGIHVSADAGASWTTIPTAGVRQAVAATSFEVSDQSSSPPGCVDLVLDPAHPHSVCVTFRANPRGQPAPLGEYRLGLLTTDDGQTWQAVPAPPGFDLGQFGGFQVAGQAVVALFGGPSMPAGPGAFAVEATSDGGRAWQPGQMPCPTRGPCVRWGPGPDVIGGKVVNYLQPIEVSRDGGRTWTTPAWPTPVDLAQGPGQLVALSATEVALVDGTGPYPLLVSHDAGQTWQKIVLPPLNSAGGPPLQYGGLQLLPTGALLAQGPQAQSWVLLPPGAQAWCRLAGLSAPNGIALPQVVGDRLWWLVPPTNPSAAAVPQSLPLSALRCGG